jgi:flagellar basal-body rod modification protein FlgD
MRKTVAGSFLSSLNSHRRKAQGGEMATTTGIWNSTTTGQATQLSQAASSTPTSASTSSTSTSNSNSGSATISANDFLTLLVTEMQNQDPTSTTDPNEYINQLVNVNSLEQLISINQTLADSASSSTASTTSGSSSQSTVTGAQSSAVRGASSLTTSQSAASQTTSGKLSLPAVGSAADRVAHALTAKR